MCIVQVARSRTFGFVPTPTFSHLMKIRELWLYKVRHTLSQNLTEYLHKNRACHGWSKCNGTVHYGYIWLLGHFTAHIAHICIVQCKQNLQKSDIDRCIRYSRDRLVFLRWFLIFLAQCTFCFQYSLFWLFVLFLTRLSRVRTKKILIFVLLKPEPDPDSTPGLPKIRIRSKQTVHYSLLWGKWKF